MKNVFIASMAFVFFSFVLVGDTISKKERKDATDLLKDTHNALLKSLEGLSEAQLNYKVSDSTWSVDGNVKHLAVVEQTILSMVEDALTKPANPDKRANIKVSDEQMKPEKKNSVRSFIFIRIRFNGKQLAFTKAPGFYLGLSSVMFSDLSL